MSQADGIRHQFGSLIGCITEHHTLVAGTGIKIVLQDSFFRFQCLIDTHGNVSGLLIKSNQNCACVSVKTVLRLGVADLLNGIPNNALNVNISVGGKLSGHKNESGAGCGLAGHTAHGILRHAGVKDGIRDGITDFVGMSFRYRFRSK